MRELPPYAGALLNVIDRLRRAGIEPAGVQIPGVPMGDGSIATFYGLPVTYAPLPGDVCVTVGTGYSVAGGA